MIPKPGCDPKINVLTIGAWILSLLKKRKMLIDEVLMDCSHSLGISVDHVILSLDWLYIIGAIKIDNEMVMANAPSVS